MSIGTALAVGSLCSGYGGLDLAVESVFGARTVWHAENDQAPSKVLAARWPGVPNLGDLTAADWAAVEPVDILTAGYPCQPDSSAGKRLSQDDHRWIFPDVARAIGVLRPGLVVLENVSGHFVRGFRTVLGSLTALGYDAQWTLVRASAVGAPHRRERLFVLAWPANAAGAGRRQLVANHVAGDRRPPARSGQAQSGRQHRDPLADAQRRGLARRAPDQGREPLGGVAAARSGGQPLADTNRDAGRGREAVARLACSDIAADAHSYGLQGVGRGNAEQRDTDRRGSADIAWGDYEPAIRRWEHLTRPSPAPAELGTRGGHRLAPRFVEWMMGLPAGWVTDVDGLSRNDQLKILGNGVVPQQAEHALRAMLAARVDA